MMMRVGTMMTAVVMTVVLTGCSDDEDCESAGTAEITTVAMADGKSGGSSGGKVKVDLDDDCDDD